MNEDNIVSENSKPGIFPALALRGISIFPGMLLNFDVERPMSIAALNASMSADQNIFLVAQKDIAVSTPKPEELYTIGTISRIKQVLRIPGSNSVRVMVQGLTRAKILEFTATVPYLYARVEPFPDESERASTVKIEAMIRQSAGLLDEYIQLSSIGTPDLLVNVMAQEDPGYVADYITQNIFLKHTQKQIILEEAHPVRRLAKLNKILVRELDILSLEQSIQESAQEQINKSQKDYYLREQLKAIQAELGEGDDSIEELDEYNTRIQKLELTKETEEKLLKEVSRLSKQPYGSTEASVIRNYLDVCLDLPWNVRTREVIDIVKARKVLDDDHFGLEKVKERIIEFLAVKKLAPQVKGDILCLVGPPGTGKTSIALSIAHATGRKLARISLGGVHDEAEIRGHRKTYVGSMPGRIINGVQQAGSINPVLVLDEIDKLGSDYRGDPSAALLEALDAEQNYAFRDHFLEVPFDLSSVFFIATANTTDTIPRPLLDRMEIIELSSYTDEEKLQIAKSHLIPKQRKKHGLNGNKLRISDEAIREVISLYTRESGVRVLERMIASICRKTATGIVEGQFNTMTVRAGGLEPLLGVPRCISSAPNPCDEVGLVQGLAWTSVGGEVLELEASVIDGNGKLELTGNLGDVMKESAKAAITYIRSRAGKLGINPDFYQNKDIHIHFPEGAVPKDGPSAGITICIGLISALTGIPVRRKVAMTGEITIRGRILPIGGLREKTMAALRNGIETVIIPAANEKDLENIDQTVRAALKFVTTDHVDKILDVALNRQMEKTCGFDTDIICKRSEVKSALKIRQ